MTDPPSPFPFQPSLHPSLFLFLPTRIRENDSLSGNWNPVIYGARRGEDSWINVQVYRGGLAYRYLGKSRLSAEAEYLSIRGAISTAGVKIRMKIWWGKVWGDKWKFMTMSRRFWIQRRNFGFFGFNDELRFYRSKSVRTDLGKFNFDFFLKYLWGWIFRNWNWKGFKIVLDCVNWKESMNSMDCYGFSETITWFKDTGILHSLIDFF